MPATVPVTSLRLVLAALGALVLARPAPADDRLHAVIRGARSNLRATCIP